MYISVYAFPRTCARVGRWDEIMAFCEMLRDAFQCQSSLAVPNNCMKETLFFAFFLCLYLQLLITDCATYTVNESNKSINDIS